MLKIIIPTLLIIQLSINGQGLNCSAFTVCGENIFLAKNLDWVLGNGLIIFNPKNKLKKSIYVESDENNSWTSSYSSITFNHLGINQPLGGMNEEGLTIEELSTWPVQYPNSASLKLSEFEWIQFQLDKYARTKEVIDNIEQISIYKFYFMIHYLVVDKFGDAAIIEFVDGKPRVYCGVLLKAPVLTNNNYSVLINYSNLISQSHLNNLNVNNSQDRFLKIVTLLRDYKNKNLNHSMIFLDAMNVLDSVKVSDTRWSIVYDITNENLYYKNSYNKRMLTIKFTSDLKQCSEIKYIPLRSNYQPKFKPFVSINNSEYLDNLIKDIFSAVGDEGQELIDRINFYLK